MEEKRGGKCGFVRFVKIQKLQQLKKGLVSRFVGWVTEC